MGQRINEGLPHVVTTTATRTRAEIERDIASKRRERELYVSPQGVGKVHGEIDALLDELDSLPKP
jgi:hypothetical protein